MNQNKNTPIEEDVLQMPIHKPIEAPTDLVNHSMDITHNRSLIDEIFGDDDDVMEGTSTAESSPDAMSDITEIVEEGTIAPKKSPSNLAKRPDESEPDRT